MSTELPAVYLGLGSNLGDRQRNLIVGLRRLEPLVRVEAVSSLYETEPVGPPDQPPYLNAVCRCVTGLPPMGLLRHVQEVERDLGRRGGERWGPRPLDMDILLYGDAVIEEVGAHGPFDSAQGRRAPLLRVPHPELPNRAFVLVPLAELAADVRHPTLRRTIGELSADVAASGVRVRAERGWERCRPP